MIFRKLARIFLNALKKISVGNFFLLCLKKVFMSDHVKYVSAGRLLGTLPCCRL